MSLAWHINQSLFSCRNASHPLWHPTVSVLHSSPVLPDSTLTTTPAINPHVLHLQCHCLLPWQCSQSPPSPSASAKPASNMFSFWSFPCPSDPSAHGAVWCLPRRGRLQLCFWCLSSHPSSMSMTLAAAVYLLSCQAESSLKRDQKLLHLNEKQKTHSNKLP